MQLQRTYSDADFARLSFHDVRVVAWAALPELFELRFDLDYLVEWLCPPGQTGPLSFRISPATLVFADAGSLEASFRSEQGDLCIDELTRSDFERLPGAAVGTWRYELRAHDGSYLRLRASGFHLYLRADPLTRAQQHLSLGERGGISFDVPRE